MDGDDGDDDNGDHYHAVVVDALIFAMTGLSRLYDKYLSCYQYISYYCLIENHEYNYK